MEGKKTLFSKEAKIGGKKDFENDFSFVKDKVTN